MSVLDEIRARKLSAAQHSRQDEDGCVACAGYLRDSTADIDTLLEIIDAIAADHSVTPEAIIAEAREHGMFAKGGDCKEFR